MEGRGGMKIHKIGKITVAEGKIIIENWEIEGGSLEGLKRAVLRKAIWALFLAWIGISERGL